MLNNRIDFTIKNGHIENYKIGQVGFKLPVCRTCGEPMIVDKLKTEHCQLVCSGNCLDEAFMNYSDGKYEYYFEEKMLKRWEEDRYTSSWED